jgi:hypothetical protein
MAAGECVCHHLLSRMESPLASVRIDQSNESRRYRLIKQAQHNKREHLMSSSEGFRTGVLTGIGAANLLGGPSVRPMQRFRERAEHY